ncbi:MAG TPA: GNAT family protein [Gaiellaceae bacterium]|nr:GNAT family protein [Gaiellaceae bacterium]
MRLEDDAIVIRPLTESDAPAVAAAIGEDADLDRWTRIPFPYTEEQAREYLASTEESAFAILDRASGDPLGGIGARGRDAAIVEIGYWVKAEARGLVVATRALSLLTRFAFEELGARVQLRTEPDNVGSQRVAEKAGFTREGTLRSFMEFKGRRRDAVMFSLLPDELENQ